MVVEDRGLDELDGDHLGVRVELLEGLEEGVREVDRLGVVLLCTFMGHASSERKANEQGRVGMWRTVLGRLPACISSCCSTIAVHGSLSAIFFAAVLTASLEFLSSPARVDVLMSR